MNTKELDHLDAQIAELEAKRRALACEFAEEAVRTVGRLVGIDVTWEGDVDDDILDSRVGGVCIDFELGARGWTLHSWGPSQSLYSNNVTHARLVGRLLGDYLDCASDNPATIYLEAIYIGPAADLALKTGQAYRPLDSGKVWEVFQSVKDRCVGDSHEAVFIVDLRTTAGDRLDGVVITAEAFEALTGEAVKGVEEYRQIDEDLQGVSVMEYEILDGWRVLGGKE